MKIRQKTDEDLKDFMDHYNRTVRQVKDVGKEFVLSSLAMTMKTGPFVDNLFARPLKTMGKM